ncbi:MAG: hypothetical protein V3W44_08705 [Dehalococcoidales bacterium]
MDENEHAGLNDGARTYYEWMYREKPSTTSRRECARRILALDDALKAEKAEHQAALEAIRACGRLEDELAAERDLAERKLARAMTAIKALYFEGETSTSTYIVLMNVLEGIAAMDKQPEPNPQPRGRREGKATALKAELAEIAKEEAFQLMGKPEPEVDHEAARRRAEACLELTGLALPIRIASIEEFQREQNLARAYLAQADELAVLKEDDDPHYNKFHPTIPPPRGYQR